MREQALLALFEASKDRLHCSFHEFCIALHDWDAHPIMRGDQIIGALISKGNEVHLGYSVLPKGSIRKDVREVFVPLLRKCGWFVTTVCEDNERGLRFCGRIGFEETKRENGIVYMRCERLNYE